MLVRISTNAPIRDFYIIIHIACPQSLDDSFIRDYCSSEINDLIVIIYAQNHSTRKAMKIQGKCFLLNNFKTITVS